MGNTIIQGLYPGKLGQLLFEDFEGLNWQSDQLWDILNGNPQATTAAPFTGTRAFALDDSFPLIENDFSGSSNPVYEWSVMHFLDDSSVITGTYTPFVLYFPSSGSFEWGIGVDLATSTGFYTVRVNGVDSATTFVRTDGYHQFAFELVGTTATLYIDGVSVASTTVTDGTFDRIRLGEITGSGTPAFGFMDDVQVGRTRNIKVRGIEAGVEASLLEKDGTVISTVISTGPTVDLSVIFNDSPFLARLVTTTPNRVSRQVFGPLVEVFAGDEFTQDIIDFGRKVTTFNYPPQVKRRDKESTVGVNETIFFSARDAGNISINHIVDDLRKQLRKWWSFAQRSFVYGIAIDSDQLSVNQVTAEAEAGDTFLEISDTIGLRAGQQLIVRHPDNLDSEDIEIASVDTGPDGVTVKDELLHGYPSGSFVRDEFYWPRVLSTDKQLGIVLSTPKVKRWNFNNGWKEEIEE